MKKPTDVSQESASSERERPPTKPEGLDVATPFRGADFFSTGGGVPILEQQPVVTPEATMEEALPEHGADFFSTGGGVLPQASAAQEALLLCHRYELRSMEGSGGMGQVWRAWDQQRAQTVAVKKLHQARDEEATATGMLQEMESLRRLRHPGIVSFLGLERDPAWGLFFVMEWFDGAPLSASLEQARRAGDKSPFSLAETLPLLEQLVASLEAAHKQGIVHLDVKPSNILRASDGTCKLVDFGIARLRGEQHGLQGTAYYMAPEQLRGEGEINAAADVYALAVVAYQLWTGQIFQGGMPGPSQLQSSLSAAVDEVHAKAVSWRATDRYASVRSWWDALRRAWKETPKPEARTRISWTKQAPRERERTVGEVVQLPEGEDLSEARWKEQRDAIQRKRPGWLSAPLAQMPPRLQRCRRPSSEEVQAWKLRERQAAWWLLSREGEVLAALQEVPAGKFCMGAIRQERGARRQDKPAVEVALGSYLIATQPLSTEAWRIFLRERGDVSVEQKAEDTRLPVANVTVEQGWEFCDFYGLSLPSEAQWERAMRYSEGRWEGALREWMADEYDARWLRRLSGPDPVLQSRERARFVSVRGETPACFYRRQGLPAETLSRSLGFRVTLDTLPMP